VHGNTLVQDRAVVSQEPKRSAVSQAAGHAQKSARGKKSASAFRTISEVADDLDVQQHVLRFWETKFSQVRPLKRGGGRRYYRPEDIQLLKIIHHLLYTEGYTIKGVQKLLRETGKKNLLQEMGTVGVIDMAEDKAVAVQNDLPRRAAPLNIAPAGNLTEGQRGVLNSVLNELKELRSLVKGDE